MPTRSGRALFVLLSLAAPGMLSAQGLLALLNPGGDRQLAVIVPTSGEMHTLGPVVGGEPVSTSGASETIDRPGNRFFFVGTPNGDPTKLFSLSTLTGAVLASPNVTNAQNGIVFADWDAGESLLFCLVSVGAGDRQLCTVNVATGAVVLRGNPIAGQGLSTADAHALDAAGNRFFFVGSPGAGAEALYSINTTNGLEASSPDINGPILGVRALAWDAGESLLFGLFTVAGFDAQLGTINTATGTVSLRGNPIAGEQLSASDAALYESGDHYYFPGTPTSGSRSVYTINTVNGIEISSPAMTASALDVLTVQFDPGPLFADGFASGNVSAWTSSQP